MRKWFYSTDYPKESYEDLENKIKDELNSVIEKHAEKGFQVHEIESKTGFWIDRVELINKISTLIDEPYKGD